MNDFKKSMTLRIYLVYLGILLFAAAIMTRAILIQSLESKELTAQAREQQLDYWDVEPVRGNICTEDGTLLAVSIPIFDIRMDVCTDSLTDAIFRKNVDSLAARLSSLFHDRAASQYRDELWEARRKGERFLLIKRKVTYSELRQLREFPLFRRGKYRGGLIVIPHFKRELPYKELARRTIGFENKDTLKKVFVGLEGFYSRHLQGNPGKRLMRRIGMDAWVPVESENELEPQNGDDIITTIDINIQDLTENALLRGLKADSAEHGCAVVMEVSTGYVKAIANLKRVAPGNYEEVMNYAVGESTEPGSTFKLASFIVAMEDGKVDLNTLVSTGNGTVTVDGYTLEDSHKGGYGTISAREVFELSSNVGTSQIIYHGYSRQPQQFIDGLYRLGIQKPLGLELYGEGIPYIKDTHDKHWSKLSLRWIPVGYEVALTPLQQLTLYNAVANNGIMVKPLLVREIRQNGRVIETFNPVILNSSICSPATLGKVRVLLEGVVERGTAVNIKNPVYKIAGKTGTAQVAQDNRGYGKEANRIQYKGSFIGYFPADRPRYSIIVVINNPSRGRYYGASIAAPVFKEIADRLYASHPEINNTARKDSIHPLLPKGKSGMAGDLELVYTGLGYPAVTLNPNVPWGAPHWIGEKVTLVPQAFTGGVMPDVQGMGLKDALYLLEQQGLQVSVRGKGSVSGQSVPAGTPVGTGDTLTIRLEPKIRVVKAETKTKA